MTCLMAGELVALLELVECLKCVHIAILKNVLGAFVGLKESNLHNVP